MSIELVAKLLQVALSPIALISGASLLMLSVTNRYGRVVDRTRALVRELEAVRNAHVAKEDRKQLKILHERAQLLQKTVLLITGSIFFSVLMVLSLLTQGFFQVGLQNFFLAFFVASVILLGVAVLLLFTEVSKSLRALTLEVRRHS